MGTVLQKTADPHRAGGHGRLDPEGFARHIRFQTYIPPAGLAPFIRHFWTLSWIRASREPYISEQVLHRPYVDVYVSRPDSGIQCAFRDKRDYVASDDGRIIGARLLPGAFRAFWSESLAGLHNGTLALRQVFPEADASFVEGVLALDDDAAAGALADLIQARRPQPDPNIALINEILAAIDSDGLQTVGDVAQWIGKSERWLQKLFQDYVGIGIKWQLQRNKLLDAAKSIRDSDNPSWADLAYDLGYSSQQHFISDFKRVLGRTPGQYKREVSSNKGAQV